MDDDGRDERTTFKVWETRGTLKCDDGRRLWTARPVTCTACGYESRHYEANAFDLGEDEQPRFLFSVPYVGLNGGTGEEVDAPEGFDFEDGQTVFLSECCDFPRMAR